GLGLIPLVVDVLAEIALAVEQRHSDDGQLEVSSGPERIAGEHAQPATVRGDRLFQADLHREIGDARSWNRRSVHELAGHGGCYRGIRASATLHQTITLAASCL